MKNISLENYFSIIFLLFYVKMASDEEIQQHKLFILYADKILKNKGYNFCVHYSNYRTITLGHYGEEFVLSPCHLLTCIKLICSIKFILEQIDENGDKKILFEQNFLIKDLEKMWVNYP